MAIIMFDNRLTIKFTSRSLGEFEITFLTSRFIYIVSGWILIEKNTDLYISLYAFRVILERVISSSETSEVVEGVMVTVELLTNLQCGWNLQIEKQYFK